METSQSPRAVLQQAYRLAQQLWPDERYKSRRDDYASPQLFTCLALRECYRLIYRRTDQLLWDSPKWFADLHFSTALDRNTL